MGRPIVLSNGELHVGINRFGLVHDFYFPYVGFENHAAGRSLRHRVGVWIDGQISWLDDGNWDIKFNYVHNSLAGHCSARSEQMGVLIEFDDVVDTSISAFLRNVHVANLRDHPREIRLFMHQAFNIGDGHSNTDTGQYLPDYKAILHYRGRRAFIIGAVRASDQKPFDQYTIGLFGIEGYEGTFRDADDGELSMGAVEHGRVDSTLRFKLQIDAQGSERVHYWIAAGTSMREALFVHGQIIEDGLLDRMHTSIGWWYKWLEPAVAASEKLPADDRDSFIRSLLIIKSQIDKRGAVIASTDTTMLNYSRDAYAYCWPRDGAFALWPLIRLGYVDEPRRFFEFCRRALHPGGYLMHKYRADGALGSSWHPYFHTGGLSIPPIQEDETALVLFTFAQFYQMHPDPRLLHEFYHSMIVPMANFMAGYIDSTTGLPRPSYDLWEEVFLTTTYTTATVYGALLAAAELADTAQDSDSAVRWRTAADDMLAAAQKYLYNKEKKAFYKGLIVTNGEIEYDETVDTSSVFGAFMFGLFPIHSDELTAAMATTIHTFGLNDQVIGVPRYENDRYYRVSSEITGNWWLISTLWMAQYYLEINDQSAARQVITWVKQHMSETGILSEQISPIDQSSISVAPLTWSHAEYVATLLDTMTKREPS